MSSKQVRRQDVAAAAGVSGATVSYVLNGRAEEMRIAAATADRVRAVAIELGYVAHGAARELRQGRTNRLAVILRLGHQPLWAPSLRSLHWAAMERGYQVLVAFKDWDEPLEQALFPSLEQTDAAIVVTGAMGGDTVAVSRTTAKPVVLVHHWPVEGFSTVVSSGAQLLELTTCHLLDQGWERLVLTTQMPHFVSGFRAALEARGLACSPDMLLPAGFDFAAGEAAADQLPDPRGLGIVCNNDYLAIGLMVALQRRGLRAGQDYGICGLHNYDAGPYVCVPLTTAHRPYREVADMAVELALEGIGAAGDETRTVTIPGRLVIRESSLRPVGA